MYEIIGHRGDKENYPENTLNGFKSSLLSKKVAGIELDVQVTKDAKLMISHDRYYVSGNNKKFYINDYTYKDYQNLPIFYNDSSKEFPLLEDVLKLYKDLESIKIILIEIKTLPASSSLPISFSQLIKEVHNLLYKYQVEGNSYIISFDYRIIKESKIQNSMIKTGMIFERNLIPINCIVKMLDLDIVVMAEYWITQEQVKELNSLNIDVFAWTINSKKECDRLANLGVKYMITDKPTTI